MILVDSTVWIDFLRRRPSAQVSKLHRLIELGEAAAAPVIVQEVLQGAADRSAFAKHRYFAGIPLAGTGGVMDLHVATAEFYVRARWRGHAKSPRLPDRRHRHRSEHAASARRQRFRAARRS